MYRWWGSSEDSERQASERDQRSARRIIASQQKVLSESEDEEYKECDLSKSFLINVDGGDSIVASDDEDTSPETSAIMVAFEDENGTDGDNALGNALRSLEKLEWQTNDLAWYFNRVEIRMGVANVKKNYTKFQVLSEIIPSKVQDQVKPWPLLSKVCF